jgi:photosystem II stability/assembly factor-like uncharacterized protein
MKLLIVITILIFSYILKVPHSEWDTIKTDITEHLHDIEFINDSVGFIYSYGTGNIYKTTDEGSTWINIFKTDSIFLEQIQFIDSHMGWICGEHGTLLKTYDCGRSWSDLSIELKNKNLLLYGMCFLNNSIGYLSGAVFSDDLFKPKFFFTKDGGHIWTEVYKDMPHMVLNLYKKGNDIFATGNGFIIRIDIGANEWHYVFRDTSETVGQIRDIEFANDNFGMAVSFNGKILVTGNGGKSFNYYELTKNRLRSIAFLESKKWIVAGDNNKNDGAVLYLTNDNGESWENSLDFPDIHRVALTEKYIWIVGKEGLIARSKR